MVEDADGRGFEARRESRAWTCRASQESGALSARISRWNTRRDRLPGQHGQRASCRVQDETGPVPQSTLCYIPRENSNNFSMLVHGIVQMIDTGKPPFPVERTLLTTGALAALMESAHQGQKRMETPELAVRYRPP